jgi:inulin fructotransferase (DFA-I-forming)
MAPTVYDVTTWPGASVSPYTDIGQVINEIIADIHAQQTGPTSRPGAVIYIPPGHYLLQTTANIDVGFLTIKGSGHGFMSEAVRDGTNTTNWIETLPGSSHVQIVNNNQVGFYVNRNTDAVANGRLDAIVFQDFCIDGVSDSKPYVPGNGKTGIQVQYDTDSLRIEGMGFVYLAHAIVVRNADAFNITNNFITECGNCIEMVNGSIVGKITNNYLISPWAGNSIFMENNDGVLISGNSLLWGARIQFKAVHRACITSNKFVSNFSGMIVHETECDENLISANQFRRQFGDGGPARNDDLYGMVQVNGNFNSVTANSFSFAVPSADIVPAGAAPTIVLVKGGTNNFLATNQISANVGVKVVLDASTSATKLLYTANSGQLQDNTNGNCSFVPTP